MAELSIASEMSESGRALFKQRLIRKQIEHHKQIIHRGDQVSGAYFVLEGCLRVFAYGREGKEITLYRINPGETCVLAINALFNDLLYPAWVESEADTSVGLLPGTAYKKLFATESAVQDLTVKALSAAVFGLMASLEERALLGVEARLINYLLLSASSEGKITNTQQEIAAQIGTSREVVGKHMANLAAKGLAKTGRGVIQLEDIDGLSRLLTD